MMSCKGEEKLIPCPYDPAHLILYHRMQGHLVKCRRNHPEAKKVICLFNSTHQVPEPEIKYHHETCSDRIGIDKFVYTSGNEESSVEKYPVQKLNVVAQESWDDEDWPTYNPEEYCINNPILRNNVIHTQSAATRRNFRMEERQRMQQFINNEQPRHPQDGGTNEVEVESEGAIVVRRPIEQSEAMLLQDQIVSLGEKVKEDANVVTVPQSSVAQENSTGAIPRRKIDNNFSGNEFPPLSKETNMMRGLPPTTSKFSYGRGSKLSEK